MPPIQQICTSRAVGEYFSSEISNLWWSRLDPLTPNAKTGVILAHGALATADYFLTDSDARQLADRITMRQIPGVATDLGGQLTWGNDTLVSRMNDTLTFFNSNLGARTDRVVVVGLSMGGTSVLNWIRNWSANDYANLSKVAAIALFVPAVDVNDIYVNDRMGLAASIDNAYSGSGGWVANQATADPANFASGYSSVPIRIWYSGDDPIIIPSIVEAWGANAGATLTNIGNVGHTINGVDFEDVASWIQQYV